MILFQMTVCGCICWLGTCTCLIVLMVADVSASSRWWLVCLYLHAHVMNLLHLDYVGLAYANVMYS